MRYTLLVYYDKYSNNMPDGIPVYYCLLNGDYRDFDRRIADKGGDDIQRKLARILKAVTDKGRWSLQAPTHVDLLLDSVSVVTVGSLEPIKD